MVNLTSNLASLGQSRIRMALGLLLALLYTRGASAQVLLHIPDSQGLRDLGTHRLRDLVTR